jgi:ribosome biogenesis GTPase
MKIEDLGYDSFFESARKDLAEEDLSVARVFSEHRGAYEIMGEDGVFMAKVTGKHMFDATGREDYPAVGDWVCVRILGAGQAIIHHILPRRTVIKRRYGDKDKIGNKTDVQIIGANIDTAFIVESVSRDFNLNRFERYLSIIGNQGIEPIIIINKIDLISVEDLEELLTRIRSRFEDNFPIISMSTVSGEGLDTLESFLVKGKTYCFLGSSGVGKSSLINKLIGRESIAISDVSSYSDRGKHTTTSRDMYILEGGAIVMDNPGIREVGITGDLGEMVFDDIPDLATKCRYSDCTHVNEPGCEVLKALEEGRIDRGRYDNYIRLRAESDYYQMSDYEKREKDRSFGKMVNKVKKDMRKYD